jgi:hypothetical protein
MFLRGEVVVNTGQCDKGDLKLGANSSTIAPSAQRILYKQLQPNSGLDEATAPGDWTQLLSQPWVSDYQLDTELLGDGEWELLTQVQNTYGWWDDLDPDFAGDGVAVRDSDEKWLKYLRTWWYLIDATHPGPTDPIDPNDDLNMVIIDNVEPDISNAFPPEN